MRIIYVSSLVSPETFSGYFEGRGVIPSIAAQKFHRLLAEGLAQDKRVSRVVSLGAPPVSRGVTRQKVHPAWRGEREQVSYRELAFVNVPLLRQASIFVGCLSELLKEARSGNGAVVCDVLLGAPSLAALLASRLTRIPVLGIVTDVPRRRPRVGSVSEARARAVLERFGELWLRSFDGYLLLTEPMSAVVNPKARPQVIVEGLVGIDEGAALTLRGDGPKIILYTGSTHKVYGLPMLVEAFQRARIPGWELHVCGGGDFDEELRDIADIDPVIHFHGVVPNDEAIERQRAAEVLVNPRPTHENFVRYSFPSKNMEYMASGRPLLTTRLPGMPAEYLPHVFLLEPESAEGYEQSLRALAALTPEERTARGEGARLFVAQHKNKVVQARKLVDLLTGMRRSVRGPAIHERRA